jgi:H+/gluconate symporter-like permease
MPSPSPTPQLVAGFIETKKSYIAAIILIIAAVVILASGYGKLKKKIKEGKMRETEENKPKTKA